MSDELYITFDDNQWFKINEECILTRMEMLESYRAFDLEKKIVYLKGNNDRLDSWSYDVRFFFDKNYIFFEISSHDERIIHDLIELFKWLRSRTKIKIQDEDGENSQW